MYHNKTFSFFSPGTRFNSVLKVFPRFDIFSWLISSTASLRFCFTWDMSYFCGSLRWCQTLLYLHVIYLDFVLQKSKIDWDRLKSHFKASCCWLIPWGSGELGSGIIGHLTPKSDPYMLCANQGGNVATFLTSLVWLFLLSGSVDWETGVCRNGSTHERVWTQCNLLVLHRGFTSSLCATQVSWPTTKTWLKAKNFELSDMRSGKG